MPPATMAECPKCGVKVKKEKLRRHINTVHGEGAAKAPPKKVAAAAVSTVAFPWKAMGALAVIALVVGAGYWYATQTQGGTPTQTTLPVAVFEVQGYGAIEIELEVTRAPRTAGNFIDLVRSGYYDGLTFHRVVENFVIQAGQGPSRPKIDWEQTGFQNDPHTIAMARVSGDWNSATTEFFINLVDNANLDRPPGEESYPYVVFGRVVGGHAYVDAIGRVPTTSGDTPDTPVVITRAYMR